MNYIFCPAYASVFLALHLKDSGEEIKIITDNISIKKYCRVAGIHCIYFDYINVSTVRFYKIFILKQKMHNLIRELDIKKEDAFYLLDSGFDISGFYLAKEWSKKGNAYFNFLGKSFNPYIENRYLSLSFLARTGFRYLCKLFLGLDLIFLEVDRSPIFGINDTFLKKNKIRNLSLDKNLNELHLGVMRKSHIELSKYDNLIASDGNLAGVINEGSLIKVYGNLLKLPHKFAVKYHPGVQKTRKLARYEELFVNCEELPDYIPVELLFNNIRKNIICVSSTSLISASQLEHLKAISLLDLVEWNHDSYKEDVRTYLTKESNNRIIFVKTFEELNKLLGA